MLQIVDLVARYEMHSVDDATTWSEPSMTSCADVHLASAVRPSRRLRKGCYSTWSRMSIVGHRATGGLTCHLRAYMPRLMRPGHGHGSPVLSGRGALSGRTARRFEESTSAQHFSKRHPSSDTCVVPIQQKGHIAISHILYKTVQKEKTVQEESSRSVQRSKDLTHRVSEQYVSRPSVGIGVALPPTDIYHPTRTLAFRLGPFTARLLVLALTTHIQSNHYLRTSSLTPCSSPTQIHLVPFIPLIPSPLLHSFTTLLDHRIAPMYTTYAGVARIS